MNPNYLNPQSSYPPYMNMNDYDNEEEKIEYVVNLFEKNVGKKVTIYSSFPDSSEWRDKTFTGNIVAGGKDFIVIKTSKNQNIIIWTIYINYATFDEEISI